MAGPTTSRRRSHALEASIMLVVSAMLATACSAGVGIARVDEPRLDTRGPGITTSAVDVSMGELGRAPCVFDEPDGVTTTCFRLQVPERWDAPDASGTVTLPVAVFSSPISIDSTVVYLEGGPGGDALGLVASAFNETWAEIVGRHRLVVFDQRGTGHAEPTLACDELSDLTIPALTMEPDQEDAAVLGAIDGCFERLRAEGVDPEAYNSVQSAHDLEALRLALEADPWDVVGVSYGTRLAQTAMREHPEGIRSIVLDGVVPIEASHHASIPSFAARAFAELGAACESDPSCQSSWPNLYTRLFALAERLDEQPVAFDVQSAGAAQAASARWDGSDLLRVVFTMLYSRDLIADVPYLVAQLEAGDTSGASLLTSLIVAQDRYVSAGMFWAVTCHEEVPFAASADYAAGLSGDPAIDDAFGTGQANEADTEALCGLVGAGRAEPVENEPVRSDIPALVLSGRLDPITPPANGEVVATRIGAAHVVLENMGHGAIAHACGRALILAFLAELDGDLDASCAAEVEAIDWAATAPSEALAGVELDSPFGSIRTLLPADWVIVPGPAAAESRPPLRQGQVAFLSAPVGMAVLSIDVIFDEAGLRESAPLGSLDLGGVAWTGRSGTIPGAVVDVWIADFDDASLIVLSQAPQAEAGRFRAVVTSLLGATRPD